MPDHPMAIIGGGTMAQAIVRGGLSSLSLGDAPIIIAEPDEAKRAAFADLHREIRSVVPSATEALASLAECESPDSPRGQILLAIKPQSLDAVAQEIRDLVGDRIVITILAGTPGERVRTALGGRCRVVRAMPNLAAKIRQGTTALCLSAGAASGDDDFARSIFRGVGQLVVTIDESMMDAFTAVAGSGPAYVFYLAEAMVRAAIELGFDEKTAADIVRETVAGAGALLGEAFETPEQLRIAVTSKGGTTEAALKVLQESGIQSSIIRAVAAARDRGRTLAR